MKKLTNWSLEARYDADDRRKHMGVLMLKSNSSQVGNIIEKIEEKQYLKKETTEMQVLLVSFRKYCMKVAFIYIRETPTQEQIRRLKSDLSNIDLVMGDLNLDPNKSTDSNKLEDLCTDRSKVLNEITTTRFNQLDHILLNRAKFKVYFATSYFNYTTDHNLLSIRIAKTGNAFNTNFLQKMSFNVDKETKNKSGERKNIFVSPLPKARKEE